MSSVGRRVGCGTGCAAAIVLSIILIVAIVGWSLSFLEDSTSIPTRQPIATDVPPARAAAVPEIDIHAAGRTSDQLAYWADPIAAEIGMSSTALRAYANAELIAAQSWPQCHLSWGTLAGIGYVESRHGTYSGSLFSARSIDENGYIQPPIIGIALDGSPGFAEIQDTDNGELDGDKQFDRAVGPMQFIPTSWARFGRDANGDGVANPNQIDDAALSAANLLCSGRDLATADGWTEAIRSYNNSQDYVNKVRDAAANYALGQSA